MTDDAGAILVTGASGLVGSAVFTSLEKARADVLRAVPRPRGRSERAFDFAQPATWGAALTGVGSLFLLRPPAIADVGPTLNAFVNAARASGVRHIVFLSVAGADRMGFLPHAKVERHLMAGPADWTLLRPGYFAQNLETALRDGIVRHGRIDVPAGRGRVAFLDVADIGDIAARCLLEPEAHAGAAYHLTGPKALGFDDAARLIAQTSDRPVRYRPAGPLRYWWRLRRAGAPRAQASVQTALHVGLRFGQGAPVTDTVSRLLGRPAGNLASYVARRAEVLRGQGH